MTVTKSRLLDERAIGAAMKKLPCWKRDGEQISRQYTFHDFNAAMAFVNRVAEKADDMDHHPDILIQYNKVRLTLSTHSAGGLTDLDFELARKIDE